MPVPLFKARLQDGKLTILDSRNYQMYLRSLDCEEGRDVSVVIKPFRNPRSNRQNKYYWKVVVETLAEELGYTKEEMHEVLKYQHLLDQSGRFPIVRDTSSLNTAEFEEYQSNVRQWASIELGIYIPLPNEADY